MIAPLEEVLAALSRLPGIGRRSAERIAFFLLAKPEESRRLTAALVGLERITRCPQCGNFATEGVCAICRDPKRDTSTLCVVARPWEIPHIEKTGEYRGRYHVLGGLVSPSQGVEPEDLSVAALVDRVKAEAIREVILALEPKLDGDLTAMHLLRVLRPLGVTVSQLAQGIPVGRDLESADELTLGRALKGRTSL
ncbi:MAG: Recombination protein RecR [Candidatus Bipolaricaulis sibiricus]|uniref:Recombination protein RecR n=1 Tax=Bipolaricaulis sibiricus TaxID=2501609 RepID=A0A410FTS4_BIPS1|nr:MAG: Recombination protein RecR [Candidatus Bipolaricaulis sibiricus]